MTATMTAPDTPQTGTQPVSLGESNKQELLNELRTEMLDRWAATLNRWLQVLAIVLTWTAVFLAALALLASALTFIGFKEFMDIRDEAKTAMTNAEDALQGIRRLRDAQTALRLQVQLIAAKVDLPGEPKDDQLAEIDDLLTEIAAAPMAELDIPDLFSGLFSDRGFEPFLEQLEGSLASGASRTERFTLSPGEYRFTAVCDDDCVDLDLILYDADNEEPVDGDLLLDAFPIVSFKATDTSEEVLVEVVMVECSDEPCAWTLDVYRLAEADQAP